MEVKKRKAKVENFCPWCEVAFSCLEALIDHAQASHGEGDALCARFCQDCGASFRQLTKLRRHVLIHSGIRAFRCGECPAAFNNGSSLRKHRLLHSGARPHACPECGAAFRDSSNLRKHLLSHRGVKYECPQCGNGYKTRWSLSVHVKTHTNDARWACPDCSKPFYTKKDLNRHRRTHAGAAVIKCTRCDVRFKRKDSFNRHFRNAHPEPPPPDAPVSPVEPVPPAQNENEVRQKIIEANNNRASVIFIPAQSAAADKKRPPTDVPTDISAHDFQNLEYDKYTKRPHLNTRETNAAERTDDPLQSDNDLQENHGRAGAVYDRYFDYGKYYNHAKFRKDSKQKLLYEINNDYSPYSNYSQIDDEKAKWRIDQLSLQSNRSNDEEPINYTPESIELYKKILCGSSAKKT